MKEDIKNYKDKQEKNKTNCYYCGDKETIPIQHECGREIYTCQDCLRILNKKL